MTPRAEQPADIPRAVPPPYLRPPAPASCPPPPTPVPQPTHSIHSAPNPHSLRLIACIACGLFRSKATCRLLKSVLSHSSRWMGLSRDEKWLVASRPLQHSKGGGTCSDGFVAGWRGQLGSVCVVSSLLSAAGAFRMPFSTFPSSDPFRVPSFRISFVRGIPFPVVSLNFGARCHFNECCGFPCVQMKVGEVDWERGR